MSLHHEIKQSFKSLPCKIGRLQKLTSNDFNEFDHPLTAFKVFVMDHREDVQERYPKKKHLEQNRMLLETWDVLTSKEREVYELRWLAIMKEDHLKSTKQKHVETSHRKRKS